MRADNLPVCCQGRGRDAGRGGRSWGWGRGSVERSREEGAAELMRKPHAKWLDADVQGGEWSIT